MAQQFIIIIMGHYAVIEPMRRNSFPFIPSVLHTEVSAWHQ